MKIASIVMLALGLVLLCVGIIRSNSKTISTGITDEEEAALAPAYTMARETVGMDPEKAKAQREEAQKKLEAHAAKVEGAIKSHKLLTTIMWAVGLCSVVAGGVCFVIDKMRSDA